MMNEESSITAPPLDLGRGFIEIYDPAGRYLGLVADLHDVERFMRARGEGDACWIVVRERIATYSGGVPGYAEQLRPRRYEMRLTDDKVTFFPVSRMPLRPRPPARWPAVASWVVIGGLVCAAWSLGWLTD
jgi:hypothetical protein